MLKNLNIEGIKRILKKGKITLLPILIASSMVLTGCGADKKSIIDKLEEKGIGIEKIVEYPGKNIYKITSCDEETLNSLKSKEIYIDNLYVQDFNATCTPSQFSNYTKENNITWNDIRNTLDNTDIEDKFKDIILRGIKNLEKNNFKINLSVLNYNLKNLKIEYVEYEETNMTGEVSASFNAESNTIFINKNFETNNFERIFIHEILGHGMVYAYLPEEKVYCSDLIFSILINDDKYNGKCMIGSAIGEALAELITYYATDEKINYDDTAYSTFVYTLLILCKSNGIRIDEFANNGVEYLISKMKENKLEYQIEYIKMLDAKLDRVIYNNTDTNYSLETITNDYLTFVADNYLVKGYDTESIKEQMNQLIDCYKPYLNPYIQEYDNITVFPFCHDYIIVDDLKYLIEEYVDSYTFNKNAVK